MNLSCSLCSYYLLCKNMFSDTELIKNTEQCLLFTSKEYKLKLAFEHINNIENISQKELILTMMK